MEIIADIAIGSGALLAAAYCMLLSRRLRALTRLDGDVGRAIALLSSQVDQMTKALSNAEAGTAARAQSLSTQIAAAEQAARRLELLMAADRPQPARPYPGGPSAVAPKAFRKEPEDEFEPIARTRDSDERLRPTISRSRSRA